MVITSLRHCFRLERHSRETADETTETGAEQRKLKIYGLALRPPAVAGQAFVDVYVAGSGGVHDLLGDG
ncbi:hypothetical protein, partial [Actinomadura sp. KC216]|uniref:hypothetical protein n=1 Tax=Actinomadura sp. KC216 TaxID=2530370 RepID=UPI001A9F85AF